MAENLSKEMKKIFPKGRDWATDSNIKPDDTVFIMDDGELPKYKGDIKK